MFARAERRLALATLATVLLVAVPAAPAKALHQACGAGYPQGTVSTGHPDMAGAQRLRGWAGGRAVYLKEVELAALGAAKGAVTAAAGISKAVAELGEEARDTVLNTSDPLLIHHIVAFGLEIPATAFKVVAGIAYGVGLVLSVVETAQLAIHFETTAAIGHENGCNGTLGGDMVDNIWIALVQRSLASDSRPPLAMLLVPGGDEQHTGRPSWPLRPRHEQGDFAAWCPEVAGSTDCTPQYHTGFLNVPDYGVIAVVESTIAHAAAHGVKDAALLEQATACLEQAKGHVASGHHKSAYASLQLAYRWAVGMAMPGTGCTGGGH